MLRQVDTVSEGGTLPGRHAGRSDGPVSWATESNALSLSSFQTTGQLKIGTYTGPLQHGIVYSGGETPDSTSSTRPALIASLFFIHRVSSFQVLQTSCVTCWALKGRTSSTSGTTSSETSSSPRSVKAGGRSWSSPSWPRSCTCGPIRAVSRRTRGDPHFRLRLAACCCVTAATFVTLPLCEEC